MSLVSLIFIVTVQKKGYCLSLVRKHAMFSFLLIAYVLTMKTIQLATLLGWFFFFFGTKRPLR